MTQSPRDDDRSEGQGPTIHDRRRIDPHTYQVREPQATAAPAPEAGRPTVDVEPGPEAPAEVDQLTTALAERTADLQRLQAEYVNYKRRVDRDRDVSRASGVESVLREMLPLLDTISSAREHDELNGAFRSVADELEKIAGRHGLEQFGVAGEPFDPNVHDALMHVPAPAGSELTGPTSIQILQPGYRIGTKVVRPARVAVAEPDAVGPAETPSAEPTDPEPSADDGA